MRKAIGMDEPEYKNFQPELLMSTYYPHGMFKNDKQGRPIAYLPIGSIDSKGYSNDLLNTITK